MTKAHNKQALLYSVLEASVSIIQFQILPFSKKCKKKKLAVHAKMLQSCPTLCDFMDCSPSGFSVPGILQARILEYIVMLFFRGSSQPRN